jgi:hypothetical protein
LALDPNAQGYKRKNVTILRPAWVVESIKLGRMLPLTEECVYSSRFFIGCHSSDFDSTRLTLFADVEVEDGPHYHTKLDNLGSQAGLPLNEADDLTEEEDEDDDNTEDRSRGQSEERKHKQPYPSPPRDVDLGGVWNLRNVRSDRQVEESETEPESSEEQGNGLSDEEGDAVDGQTVSKDHREHRGSF